ncbi:hypothetical protein GGR50DRAFT_660141, partial [Xylaria sp. CBS 124048]
SQAKVFCFLSLSLSLSLSFIFSSLRLEEVVIMRPRRSVTPLVLSPSYPRIPSGGGRGWGELLGLLSLRGPGETRSQPLVSQRVRGARRAGSEEEVPSLRCITAGMIGGFQMPVSAAAAEGQIRNQESGKASRDPNGNPERVCVYVCVWVTVI